MTNRKNWQLGASSIISTRAFGINENLFKCYKEEGVKFAELSMTARELEEIDFVKNPSYILELANRYDVTISSLHLPYYGKYSFTYRDDEIDALATKLYQEYILAGLKIGVKTFVIHPTPASEKIEEDKRELAIQKIIKNLTVLSNFCFENGAVLAIENLPRTCLGNCFEEMYRFIKSIPNVKICFDTNHLLKEKNEAFLDKLIAHNLQGIIHTIHVSDYDYIDEKHWLPFLGVNNWEAILSKLEQLDYDGVFMYEVSKPRDKDYFYLLAQVKNNYNQLINL